MNKPVALMDLDSPKMTMRDIITAMSRPTKGSDLKFVSKDQQSKLMKQCVEGVEHDIFNLRKRESDAKSKPPSERPTPSRVGR